MGDLYVCPTTSTSNNEEPDCPYSCVGLYECQSCECAVRQEGGGPWGKAMDVIMCLLPIIFLLVATLVPKPLPTTISLPVAAIIMFLVRLMYLGSDPLLTCGSVISGAHEAFTPLSIMAGAIMLFESMEATNCMPYMMREMKVLTVGNTVTELMIIFSFAYMVEGASGFGTPVALGAPMLVSLGHRKLPCVVVLLLMNTFATVWGAAGTPIWFGFGTLGLSEDELLEISYKAGVALAVAAYLLVPLVLLFLIDFNTLRGNIIFVYLGITSTVLPSLGLSFVSYEFPSLIGGMIGCVVTAALIKYRVGLKPLSELRHDETGRHPLDIGTVSDSSIIAGLAYVQMLNSAKAGSNNGHIGGMTSKPSKPQSNDEQHDTQNTGGNEGEEKLIFNEVPKNQETSDNNISNSSVRFKNGTETSNVSSSRDTDYASPPAESMMEEQDEEDARSANGDDDSSGCQEVLTESQRLVHNKLGPRKTFADGYLKETILRTFPIWGTVVILVLTRVPQIGLKDRLTQREPSFTIYFNTYGTFKMSASLVLQLYNILTYPNLNWRYELLYVPFLVPFTLVSFITIGIFRKELNHTIRDILFIVLRRLAKPAIALLGALILVQLMIKGGEASPANIIGTILSDALKGGWIVFSPLIGALGSFFSGSTTVSNLTFGEVQIVAAESIGVSVTAMLALQAAGASAGNGVCINNIISACTVVGLVVGEGKIISQTCKIVLSSAAVSTLVLLGFLFS